MVQSFRKTETCLLEETLCDGTVPGLSYGAGVRAAELGLDPSPEHGRLSPLIAQAAARRSVGYIAATRELCVRQNVSPGYQALGSVQLPPSLWTQRQ